MKQLYPVQVAEYTESNKLMSEPTFAWWTPFTLNKREQIIGAVKAHLKKKTHKYGVLVPNTVKEAYMLDKEAGNTLWRDSISKEMKIIVLPSRSSTITKLPRLGIPSSKAT